ncbi:uncharacterized protein [Lolium perenne]|uniref:uncharacterized protein n=1 Tax=Lolium perenne TaxID=4522 RepID=UPI0021F64B8C|nr:uncharacterized protein LOC127303683 [Lolium perenne]
MARELWRPPLSSSALPLSNSCMSLRMVVAQRCWREGRLVGSRDNRGAASQGLDLKQCEPLLEAEVNVLFLMAMEIFVEESNVHRIEPRPVKLTPVIRSSNMISLWQHHHWKPTNVLMVTPFRGLTLRGGEAQTEYLSVHEEGPHDEL